MPDIVTANDLVDVIGDQHNEGVIDMFEEPVVFMTPHGSYTFVATDVERDEVNECTVIRLKEVYRA